MFWRHFNTPTYTASTTTTKTHFNITMPTDYARCCWKLLAKIRKGMHGLQQAVKIAYDGLQQHILPCWCVPTKHTPRLWHHITSNLTFTFIVDDFVMKQKSIAKVKHFIHALQQKYEITVDWTVNLCVGFSLDWDCVDRTVKLSTPGLIKKVLMKHAH